MEEMICQFNKHGVRYLVIGGQAVRLEGMPRFSMDWDVYLPPSDLDNMARINKLIADELDVPLLPLGRKGENFIQTYQTRWGIVQFHLGGPGLPPFGEAESRAVTHPTEDGIPVRCMSGHDLLKSKKAANRPEDRQDILFLEEKRKAGVLS